MKSSYKKDKRIRYLLDQADAVDRVGSPERNLLAEILIRAITDYMGWSADVQRHVSDARAWLCIDRNFPKKIEPFSFMWICEHLDLSHEMVRRRILEESQKPRSESSMIHVIHSFRNLKY